MPYKRYLRRNRHVGQLYSSGLHALCGHNPVLDWDSLLDCGPRPRDPAELERWTAGRDALERLKPFLKEREEHLARYAKQRDYQTALAALKARDPLFGRTMRLMEHYVGKLPEVLRKLVMPVLAREFGLFAEFYRVVRESAWLVEAHLRAGRRKASAAPHATDEQAAPDELAALKRRV